MKVRTCHKCPYTAGDLGSYYDSGAADHCCLVCDLKPPKAPKYPVDQRKPIRLQLSTN